ncbi:hypothetical protein BB427_03255 [Pseudoalteromonas sp. BMB]|uniref:hypothetical protein n=1 Tax=Pseudoalteromonas sp. BMB TaxID=1874619 RepID=UPI00083DF603|nr:hypothetical protein [Pseudoalteromonas sp. BMB]ODB35631.1 hypothetical protein BB427_03255 [Pseudoalteromonas sp. BMB]
MKVLLFATLSLTSSVVAYAYPQVIFNAEDQCQSRTTSLGERFIPPCEFRGMSLEPLKNDAYSNSSIVSNGRFKTVLNYTFMCESLRSLSVRYTLSSADGSSSSNRIAGARTHEPQSIELTHGNSQTALNFEALDGTAGFQAIKPGCQLEVQQLVTYPEPYYFDAVARDLKSMNGYLSHLVSIAVPTSGHNDLLASINDAIIVLEELAEFSEDEITKGTASEIVSDLNTRKRYLQQYCGAGSTSTLCTSQMANLRNALLNDIRSNEITMSDLSNYLGTQISFLQDKNIGRDLTTLKRAKSNLR